MVVACESPKLQAFYIPQLGTAPKWCSYLDSLTEELEENPQPSIYDDYKFVTKKELETLGLDHLYGTNLLRAYMHGFFVDIRLYEKAKAISNPFEYEDYRKKALQERLEKARGSRISIQKRKLPNVNKVVAQKLLEEKGTEASEDNPLGDDRFGAMFRDPKFQVDENSEEYKLMYPQKRMKALEESFRKVTEDPYKGEKEGRDSDDSSDSEDSDDGTPPLFLFLFFLFFLFFLSLVLECANSFPSFADLMLRAVKKKFASKKGHDDDDDDDEKESEDEGIDKERGSKGPKFYELKQGHSLKSLTNLDRGLDKRKSKSFGERLRTSDDTSVNSVRGSFGNMELKYIPKQGVSRCPPPVFPCMRPRETHLLFLLNSQRVRGDQQEHRSRTRSETAGELDP